MTFLYFSMLMISVSATFFSHPIFLLISILLQTLMICLIIWIFTKSSWFSFILFLIFLGGLMVLFVYITSLASNEKFEQNFSSLISLITLFSFLSLLFILMTNFYKTQTNLTKNVLMNISLIFSENMIIPTLLIMLYLLYVLIVAVKISSKSEGPLRNFIK